MPNFQTYNVTPTLPPSLEPLREMTLNLWWTWEPSARSLFRHLDPELWDRTNHNPVRMLQLSRQGRLELPALMAAFANGNRRIFTGFFIATNLGFALYISNIAGRFGFGYMFLWWSASAWLITYVATLRSQWQGRAEHARDAYGA